MRRPERAEAVEPGVDVLQRLGVHRVEAAGAVRAHRREPRLPEHAEVLGDRGLGDAELRADDAGDRARRLLAGGEQLEDPAADGIAEDVEGVHDAPLLSKLTYISQYLADKALEPRGLFARCPRRRAVEPA